MLHQKKKKAKKEANYGEEKRRCCLLSFWTCNDRSWTEVDKLLFFSLNQDPCFSGFLFFFLQPKQFRSRKADSFFFCSISQNW